MPTENRSSNTDMVSDAEMTECQFHNNCGGWCETRRELEHNLCEHCLEAHDEEMASPAQQHQGEPVAWRVATGNSHRSYDFLSDAKAAIEHWKRTFPNGEVEVEPLYTHADPGEVERLRNCLRTEVEAGDSWKREAQELRARLEAEKKQHAQVLELATRRRGVIAKQDAKLAERDALLERAYRVAPPDLGRDIRAALSASAEPSTPVAQA